MVPLYTVLIKNILLKKEIRFFSVFFSILLFLSVIPSQHVNGQCTPTSNNALPSVTPSNLKCTGVKNGYLNINFFQSPSNAYGGTFPYSYEWRLNTSTGTLLASGTAPDSGLAVTGAVQPGGSALGIVVTNGKMSNLDSGTYVLVTCDSKGNQFQFNSSKITAPASVFSFQSTTFINPLCPGASTGSASAVVSGGSPPYTYSWNTVPVQTTATATNLKAGTYTITAKDFNKCLVQHTYTLTDPPTLTATIASSTNSCPSTTNGSANGVAGGGTPPYTYSWNSTPVQTTAKATGLPPGTFTFTVTDANNCTTSSSITILSVTNPAITISTTTPTDCGSNNGTATANAATGGTSPFRYLWTRSGPPQVNPSTPTALTATALSTGNYTITVTDTNNCTASAAANVGFKNPPALTINPSAPSICAGASVTLTAVTPAPAASYTYLWNTGATTIPITVSPASTATYSVTLTDNTTGCTNTASATVTVNPIPVISISVNPATPICAGNTVTLTASSSNTGASTTYAWTTPSASNNNPLVSPALFSNTTFTVTGTDAGCTSAPVTKTVVVNPLPTITVIPASPSICAGSSVQLTASGASTYSWSPSTGLSATNIANPVANPASTQTYTVTGTDVNGCVSTGTVTVTVNPIPVVTINPNNTTICKGNSTDLTASGATTYSWGPPLAAGTTTPSVNVSPAGTTTYTVTGTTNGCSATATATVNVILSLNVTASATNPSICAGGSSQLTATGALTYSWSPATGLTSTTSANPIATPPGTTTYTVTGKSGSCSNTATVTVTVVPNPTVSISGNPTTICNGSSTDLTASGATSYLWGAPIAAGTTTPKVTVSPSGNTTYTVTGTTAGCSSTASILITVNPLPTITVNPTSVTTCVNTPVDLTASGNSASYSWSPATYLNMTTGASVKSTPNAPGTTTYTVTGTLNGCSSTATTTVTSNANPNPPPVISLSPSSLCAASLPQPVSVSASNLAPGSTYSWSFGGCAGTTTSNNPTLNVSYPASCTTGAQAVTLTSVDAVTTCLTTVASNVQIDANVGAVTASSNKASICNGNSINLTATGGAGATLFTWSPATTPPTGVSVTASPSASGSYTVTASNGSCKSTSSVPITVTSVVTANAGNPQTICNGQTIILGGLGASVTASGGATPYKSYVWTASAGPTPASTANPSIIPPTGNITYTVVVTDANDCIGTASVTITVNPSPVVSTAPSSTVCNGTATPIGGTPNTATGGTPGYTYAWSPAFGLNSTTVANPMANPSSNTTYSVVVTDSKGCTGNASLTLTVKSSPTVSFGGNPFLCNGSSTTLSPTIAGGTTPYTYTWVAAPGPNPSGAAPVVSPTVTTTYTLTVTDANSCTGNASVTVNVNPALILNPGSDTTICAGVTRKLGGAPTASGGAGPTYNYNWVANVGVNPSSVANPSVTPAVTTKYTLTVTDNATLCTATKSTTVKVSPPFTKSIVSETDASCGQSDGALTISASGGTGALTYTWTPNVSTTTSAAGIPANNYKIVIKDALGCKDSITNAIVNNIGAPVAAINNVVDVKCNGASTGSANLFVQSGGTGPFTYSWNTTPIQTTQTASNLPAGIYVGTIKDSKGCVGSASVTIKQPTAITTPISSTPVSCFGLTDGTATVTPAGGTGPYTYVWSPAPGAGQNSASVTGLSAQPYTVTVTDASLCTATANVTIGTPTGITVTLTSKNVDCKSNATGSIALTTTGGTGPYTYTWAAPLAANTTSVASGLVAGTYSVTVKDVKGCMVNKTQIITEPSLLSTTASSTTASCGISDGTATASPTGGTVATVYSFQWAPSGQVTNPATNLASGNYTVKVTDDNGCTASATTTVTSTVKTLVTITKNNDVSCFGGSDGSATAIATNGTAPYSFSWDGQPGTPGGAISTLNAGTHNVVVTDKNFCVTTVPYSIAITQPTAIVLNTSVTQNSCSVSNGTASVAVSGGGTAPYTYSWNTTPVQTTAIATGLSAGTYTVSVTDAKGCIQTKTAIITTGTLLSASTTNTPVTCFGGNDGTGMVTASGGSGTYTYSWSPAGGTAASATNLPANTYTVTVSDGNTPACATSTSVTITQPSKITFTSSLTAPTSCAAKDAQATVTPSGGNGGFTHSWNPPAPQTTATVTGLSAGVPYTDVVTDSKGCSSSITVVIPTLTGPSPVNVTVNKGVSCFGTCDGQATVSATGLAPLTYSWTGSAQTTSTVSNLCAGPTTVSVTDKNGCVSTQTATITGPTVVSVSITGTNVSCFAGASGSATGTVTGGNAPYNYKWTNSAGKTIGNGLTVNNLTIGTYTLMATDVAGCTGSQNITITQPASPVSSTTTQTNLACKGVCSAGKATVTGNGGTGPYTYSWNTTPTQPTATATNLCAGNYIATTTDAAGCTSTSNVTITEPTGLTITSKQTNPSCNLSNGSIQLTVTGGTGSYVISWNPANPPSLSINNLAAGVYTATITDNGVCSQNYVVNLPNIVQAKVDTSKTDPLCVGSATGTATAIASGTTAPYTYVWNSIPAQTTPTAKGLKAGTYSVSVTDNLGCVTPSTTVTLKDPAPVVVSVTTTAISCAGGNDGTAIGTASGGLSPYTYKWAHGPVTAGVSGLAAGSYTLIATDANSCLSAPNTISLTNPTQIAISKNISNPTCNNSANGSVTATVTGGSAPYTYSWSPKGGVASTASNLTAGKYFITITDAKNCTFKDSVVLISPSNLKVIGSVVSNPTCNGKCDGVAAASGSGGTSPYTYSWNSPVTQTTQQATNLCAGTYIVTLTDAQFCFDTTRVTLTAPLPITITTTSVNASCGKADGSITATVSGGTIPYKYSWTPLPGTGNTSATYSGIPAGAYTLTVTDTNKCSATINSGVNNPPPAPTVSIQSVVNASCKGSCDGSATIFASGNGPFTYTWSSPVPASNTSVSAASLCAGSYTVTATDANKCIGTKSLTITEPILLTVSTSRTNVTCFGAGDGTATATPTGGVAPYTYSWNTTPAQTGAVASGLTPGTYTVNVTDANGCKTSGSITIIEPAPIVISLVTNTPLACNGDCNGRITATTTGGISPFTYSWNTSPVQTSLTASALCVGTYTLTVTDSKGCTALAKQTLTQPKPIYLRVTTVNATCKASNGSATAMVDSGGVAPFTYKWNNGATTSAINNLPSASYNITVTDSNKCTKSLTANISDSKGPIVVTSKTDPTCAKGNDGTATATVKAAGVYIYNWSTTPNKDTATAINLRAGIYNVTVTDALGCKTVAPDTLIDPPAISIFTTTKNASCNGGADGTATATATNGKAPYVYNWSNLATGATINNLAAGSYTVTVSDVAKCNASANVLITDPSLLTLTNSQTNVTCAGGSDGTATVTVANGTSPYFYSWSPSGGNGATAYGLSAKIKYTVTVTDANGCSIASSVTLTEPLPIAPLITNPNPVTCSGLCNGSLSASASGGSGIYTYSWNTTPAQNTQLASGLCAGTYTVTIKDKALCTSKGTYVLADPLPITLTTSSTQATCAKNDGSATVKAQGGKSAFYTYLWSNNQTTATATGLVAGAYTVTVTDTNGCTANTSVGVSNPNGPAVTLISNTNASCNGICDGTASINATGPNSPFFYLWTNKQTSASATALCAGNQVVTATNQVGCVTALSVSITQPSPLKIKVSSTDITCNGGSNGTATGNVTGGTSPYSYSWSNGAGSSAMAKNLKAGSYTLTVTDLNKCSQISIPAIVAEPAAIIPTLTVNGFLKCNGDCNNSITATVKGGTAPFTYVWNTKPLQFTATATALCAGTDSVTITDANGCSVKPAATITQPAAIMLSLTHVDIACNTSGGSATVKVLAPTPGAPFTYLWNTSDTSSTIKNKPAGNYKVTVQNTFGCRKDTSVGINNLTGPKITSVVPTNAFCIATCNGSALVSTNAASGTPPFTYSWNDPKAQNTAQANLLCAGNYAVTVTDAKGCIAVSSSVNITVPTLTVSANPLVGCQGNLVQLSGSGPAAGTISWKASGGGTFTVPNKITTTYTTNKAGKDSIVITYTNASCVPYTKLFLVDVKQKPTANPVLPAGIFCQGAPVVLTGSNASKDKITWTAQNTAGFPTGSFSDISIAAPTYTPTANEAISTILTMTVDNGICPATGTITIPWAKNSSVVADTTKILCKKDVVNLKPVLGGGATGLIWSTSGDGQFSPSKTVVNPVYIPGPNDTTSGNTIVLSMTTTGGCNAKTASTPVIVKPLPTVFAGADQVIPLGQNAILKGAITGASNPVWSSTGCGTFSPNNLSLNAAYIPCEADQHKDTIRMTLTTTNGCRPVSAKFYLHVRQVNFVDVITPYPTSPGINDVFVLPGLPDDASIVIFDRWGLKVFSAKKYKNDWDGEGLPVGIYYYVVEINGAKPIYGNVTIIRSE
jgi:hypothetical protein